jgi:hypothetical protein
MRVPTYNFALVLFVRREDFAAPRSSIGGGFQHRNNEAPPMTVAPAIARAMMNVLLRRSRKRRCG